VIYKKGVMRKTVSKGNYTLFFEDKNDSIDCIAYKTGQHMSAIEIGNAFWSVGFSVQKDIEKLTPKIYTNMKKRHRDMSPCDIVTAMAVMFNVNYVTEYKQLLRLFPKWIRRELYEIAKSSMI
jgi:hypothetical protein